MSKCQWPTAMTDRARGVVVDVRVTSQGWTPNRGRVLFLDAGTGSLMIHWLNHHPLQQQFGGASPPRYALLPSSSSCSFSNPLGSRPGFSANKRLAHLWQTGTLSTVVNLSLCSSDKRTSRLQRMIDLEDGTVEFLASRCGWHCQRRRRTELWVGKCCLHSQIQRRARVRPGCSGRVLQPHSDDSVRPTCKSELLDEWRRIVRVWAGGLVLNVGWARTELQGAGGPTAG